ncbi:MAG: hypothetical protein ACLFNQ_08710 [Spirochaetaceae bacterium]
MNRPAVHRRIARGWGRIASTLAGPLLAAGAIVIISGGIVLPLWFLATRAPGVYGASVLSVSAAAILVWTVKRVRSHTTATVYGRRRSGAVWFAAPLALVGVYGTWLVYTRAGFLAALPLLLILIAAIGFSAGGGSGPRD